MWWQLFIVLLATAAASEDDEEEHSPNCMSLMRHECESEDETPQDFPGNGEELEEFCRFALNYFDCTDRVFSSCGGQGSDFGRFLGEMGGSIRRICKENPLLRTAVAATLPCFKANMRTIGICEETFSLDQESFTDAMKKMGVTDVEEELDDSGRRCLNTLYVVGCTVATTSQLCGDVARDIVLNIFQGFDAPFEMCPPRVKEKIPEIAEVMELEAEKAKSVENILKKKK